MSFLAGSAFQSLSLRKVLLSQASCLAGALLNEQAAEEEFAQPKPDPEPA